MPSPIAESPAREQAASDEDSAEAALKQRANTGAVGVSSPLTREIAPAADSIAMVIGEVPRGRGVEETTEPAQEGQPQDSTPPKFFDTPSTHTAGPGAFVDEPDSMSMSYQQHSRPESRAQEDPNPTIWTAPPQELGFSDGIGSSAPSVAPSIVVAPVVQPDSPELKTSVEEPSYFTVTAVPVVDMFKPSESREGSLHEAIHKNTMGDGTTDKDRDELLSQQTTPRPKGSTADAENSNVFYAAPPEAVQPFAVPPGERRAEPGQEKKMPEPAVQPVVIQIPVPQTHASPPPQSHASVPMNPMPEPQHSQPIPVARKAGDSEQEPYKSLPIPIPVVFTHEAWDGEQAAKSKDHANGHASVAESDHDPFADRHQVPGYPHIAVVEYPLPPFHEVAHGRSAKDAPSMGAFTGNDSTNDNDQQPLLQPPPPVPRRQGHGYMTSAASDVPNSTHPHVISVSPMPMDAESIPSTDEYSQNQTQYHQDPPHHHHHQAAHASYTPQHRLSYLGFIEFALPDGGVYYIHTTRRVVVDSDLRKEGRADDVHRYLNVGFDSAVWNNHTGCAEPGWELWLKEIERPKKKKPMVKGKKAKAKGKARMTDLTGDEEPVEFTRYWVDHKGRRIIVDPDTVPGDRGNVDDALDGEYRYWSFMEDHPAHTSLPSNARKDAMDVLNWTWSDRLLRPADTTTAPFTQEECKHLLDHMKQFGDMQNDPSNSGIQSFVHTRVVARVLMRSTQWRQATFRPRKPFPQDVSNTKRHVVHPVSPVPFRKRFLDFIVSIFFLGVPYIFLHRMHPSRLMDEEGGIGVLKSAAGPMMVIGACTCLVAAIILSASITFLSLPGLDAISRAVGLVAALLATFSMIATVVAIFKYKSDLERSFTSLAYSGYGASYGTIPGVGFGPSGEGMMVHSKRIVILSLPLTLLVYSVMAFVAAIVLYSFFGKVTDVPLAHHFESYTQWSVVGVLGGLTGVLCTAMLMLRK
ncbi:hypothetical protein PM082_012242 [Marasmius tenuissimus]|nr:hypothetical protein PM082_012242 [Marasmius tenuissimus]